MLVNFLFGPICAGKTEYSKHLQEDKGYMRISFDELRIMLYGNLINDANTDSYICDIIDSALMGCLPDTEGKKKVVLDGYPLDIRRIGNILSRFNASVLLFNIDLYTANIRNRTRRRQKGIYIEPDEIRRYNKVYNEFINSDEFRYQCNIARCPIHVMKNSESTKCLVM